MQKRILIDVEPYRFCSTWLVSAKSLFLDRFHEQVELIHMPGACYAGGKLTLVRDAEQTTRRTPRPSVLSRVEYFIGRQKAINFGDRPIIDLRFENFMNWSHQLNKFLPLCLYMREKLANEGETITVLFPSRIPRSVEEVYRNFGFNVVNFDGRVTGYRLFWLVENDNIIHSHVHDMVRPLTTHNDIDLFPFIPGLPNKIFISRRETRKISNVDELEEVLKACGYETIHAEDYPPLTQFALLRQAKAVVAIHGAALGPLLYRIPGSDFQLLEILPAGMMTNYFRITVAQVGGRYCAVRGRIKPEYVKRAYGSPPMLEHSFDDFEVDVESVKVGLKILTSGGLAEGYPEKWID